jgi:hypothetical protein
MFNTKWLWLIYIYIYISRKVSNGSKYYHINHNDILESGNFEWTERVEK